MRNLTLVASAWRRGSRKGKSPSIQPLEMTVATELTADEIAIFEEISKLGRDLNQSSLKITGNMGDPRFISVILFRRLWGHHQGFKLLWDAELGIESATILRSGIEATICIAANFKMQEDFARLIREDAAFTLGKQTRLYQEIGADDLVTKAKENTAPLLEGVKAGEKPGKLDWKSLAESGKLPQLYRDYINLSGVSAHITGLSVMRGVVGAEENDGKDVLLQNKWSALDRVHHYRGMACATLTACHFHSRMIDDDENFAKADDLVRVMNELSKAWI